MSFELDMAATIQRYMKEVHNRDLTIDEIMSWPRWKRVWIWWQALEMYEGKPKSELSLEEVKRIYGD